MIQILSGTTKAVIIEKPSSARLQPLRTETSIAPTVVMPQNHLECVSKMESFKSFCPQWPEPCNWRSDSYHMSLLNFKLGSFESLITSIVHIITLSKFRSTRQHGLWELRWDVVARCQLQVEWLPLWWINREKCLHLQGPGHSGRKHQLSWLWWCHRTTWSV